MRRACWPIGGLSLLLAGCASLPGDQLVGQPNSPSGAVEISEIRAAPPPVVFEAGIGNYKEIWNKIFSEIGKTNTVFAYDRPGIGRSDAVPRPRDGLTIVNDLRATLHARGIASPYLLVGYSAGGLYMQLFARRYPNEVAGLVLIDPTHPTQFEGAGSMQNRSAFVNAVVNAALGAMAKAEFDALDETGREVLASPPLATSIPTVILVAQEQSDTAIAAFDNAKRADFTRLYPGATIRAMGDDHDMPQDKPDVVIDAIRATLARITKNKTALSVANPGRPSAPGRVAD